MTKRDHIEAPGRMSVSGLLRESATIATNLQKWLCADASMLRQPLADITEKKQIVISKSGEFKHILQTARCYAVEQAKNVNPQVGLPTLLRTINRAYYGPKARQLIRFGPTLKIGFAFVTGRVHEVNPSPKCLPAFAGLQRAVAAARLFEQLHNVTGVIDLFGIDGDFIKLSGKGIIDRSTNMRAVQVALLGAAKRGDSHRTLDASIKALWTNRARALEAIHAVLNGASAKDQRAFAGTFFERIPDFADKRFWSGLYVRLCVASKALLRQTAEIESPDIGICILSDLDTSTTEQLACDAQWYEDQNLSRPDDLIVRRPVIPLPEEGRYLTSFVTLGDSLNAFVESSVLDYADGDGVELPDSIFETSISRAFEGRVIDLFRRKGFVAGEVTKKGAWKVGEETVIELVSTTQQAIPGQIDCVAYHDAKRVLFVTECKVLGFPDSFNRMRNLILKFGEADSERFHSKLQRKVEWLQKTSYFESVLIDKTFNMIVLDDDMPGVISKQDYRVADLEDLNEILSSV